MARKPKNEAPVTVSRVVELVHANIENITAFQYGNPRRMRQRMGEILESSIKELGFVEPIVGRRMGDKIEILNGHHRVEVMRKLGEKTVPVTIVEVPDETKAKALALSLNRISADWTKDELEKYITDILQGEGSSVSWVADVTGFSGAEVDALKYDSAGFLDDVLNEPSSTEPKPKPAQTPRFKEGETITFFLEPTLKKRFYDALKNAKKQAGVSTTPEAILWALEQSTERKP